MVANFDRCLKWSLRADAIWSGVVSIAIPLAAYVAMPAYAKMYKVPDPAAFIFNARMTALAFGLFFLLKVLVNIKAMLLTEKWLWASMLLCLPTLYYAIFRLPISNLFGASFEDLFGTLVYVLTIAGTSLAIVIFGAQKVLRSRSR